MKSKCTALMVVTMLLAGVSAPAASLVGWWTAQNNANDVIGSNHGTLGTGAEFAPGRYGQGFSFNGVAGYVSVPHSPSLRPGTNSFSLAAWIKTTNGVGWRNIIAQYEGSGSSFGYGYYGGAVVDGKLRFDLRDTDRGGDLAPDVGGGQKLVGENDVADGLFHHVAFVREVEQGEMRIYLDGALEASDALNVGATGTIQDDDGEDDPVIIGGARDTYLTTVGGIFDGIVDEVQYYRGALSAQQIYLANRGFEPGFDFTDWTSLDLTNNIAFGTLDGTTVTFFGDTNLHYSVIDESSTEFACETFSPPLANSDFIYLAATPAARTYSFVFGAPVRNPVIHLQSFASETIFNSSVTGLSGSPIFHVTGSTVSGEPINDPDICGGTDANGSIRLNGVFNALSFNLRYTFGSIDGIYLQLGGTVDRSLRLALAPDGSGGYFIRFDGVAGFTYELQRAPNVTGPWTSNATVTAIAPGLIEFHDTNAPLGSAFYRTVTVP